MGLLLVSSLVASALNQSRVVYSLAFVREIKFGGRKGAAVLFFLF